MADPLVTRAQLETRIGAVTLQRVADDNNDSVADKVVIDQILEDASGYVRGGMPQHDPDDLTPANALITTELRRLALDVAEMMCAKRRPTILKKPWMDLKDSIDKDLDRLIKGQRSLGSKTNPVPADHSVSVASGDPGQGSYWP